MVVIPPQFDPTIQAIRQATVAARAKEPRRNYLGASEIGEKCSRRIWYSYNGYPQKERPAEVIWAAECGYRSEDVIAARLRSVGVKLQTHDTNGKQFGFSALGGKFQGHCDGLIAGGLHYAPKAKAVWESKSKNAKKFEEFKKLKLTHGFKGVLRNYDWTYFIQAQIYCHYFNMDRHYTVVALAGCRDMDTAWTEYEPEIAAQYIDRAENIINAKAPPPRISEKSDHFVCRLCPFADTCHG